MGSAELGTVWMGFNAKGRFNVLGNLRVIDCPGGSSTWNDPGLAFGPTDKKAVERSARPVRIAGGMGTVWTVHDVRFWSCRINGVPDNSAWTLSTICTGISSSPLDDPHASHFIAAADDLGSLHPTRVENFDVLYFACSAASGRWSAPVVIDDSRKLACAQMGSVNGKLGLGYRNRRAKGTLAVSSDFGNS